MNLFFTDPDDAPVPPEEVRIRAFRAEAYPDGKRIRINLEVSPFQERPYSEIVILNADGKEVAMANIIEPMSNQIEITLHLRSQDTSGTYTAKATLSFAREIEEERRGDDVIVRPEYYLVDSAETTFEIR